MDRPIAYASAIVDECGYVVCYTINMSDEEVSEILELHPEWRKTCIEL